MTETRNQSIWKNFIHLIRQIRLPVLFLVFAFLFNLGRAAIELTIPEKIAGLADLEFTAANSPVVEAAVSICLTLFALALAEFVGGLASTYTTYIAKARIHRNFQAVASRKVFSLTAAET